MMICIAPQAKSWHRVNFITCNESGKGMVQNLTWVTSCYWQIGPCDTRCWIVCGGMELRTARTRTMVLHIHSLLVTNICHNKIAHKTVVFILLGYHGRPPIQVHSVLTSVCMKYMYETFRSTMHMLWTQERTGIEAEKVPKAQDSILTRPLPKGTVPFWASKVLWPENKMYPLPAPLPLDYHLNYLTRQGFLDIMNLIMHPLNKFLIRYRRPKQSVSSCDARLMPTMM